MKSQQYTFEQFKKDLCQDKPNRTLIIKGLSLSQPWCSAMVAGKKMVENRKWKISNNLLENELWIALHAAFSYDTEGEKFLKSKGIDYQAPLPKGCILGVGRVKEVVTESKDPLFFGPYGFVFDVMLPLEKPIEMKGALSLWAIPPEAEKELIGVILKYKNEIARKYLFQPIRYDYSKDTVNPEKTE